MKQIIIFVVILLVIVLCIVILPARLFAQDVDTGQVPPFNNDPLPTEVPQNYSPYQPLNPNSTPADDCNGPMGHVAGCAVYINPDGSQTTPAPNANPNQTACTNAGCSTYCPNNCRNGYIDFGNSVNRPGATGAPGLPGATGAPGQPGYVPPLYGIGGQPPAGGNTNAQTVLNNLINGNQAGQPVPPSRAPGQQVVVPTPGLQQTGATPNVLQGATPVLRNPPITPLAGPNGQVGQLSIPSLGDINAFNPQQYMQNFFNNGGGLAPGAANQQIPPNVMPNAFGLISGVAPNPFNFMLPFYNALQGMGLQTVVPGQ